MTGHIKALCEGFGFIAADGYPDDVFFHRTDLVAVNRFEFSWLTVGELVTFDVVDNVRGPRARNVQRRQQQPS